MDLLFTSGQAAKCSRIAPPEHKQDAMGFVVLFMGIVFVSVGVIFMSMVVVVVSMGVVFVSKGVVFLFKVDILFLSRGSYSEHSAFSSEIKGR